MPYIVARTPSVGDSPAVEHGRLSLSSIQAAEKVLWVAAFETDINTLDTENLGASTDWSSLTTNLTDLMNKALKQQGSVEVLYLGDLKPKCHPFESVSLFHLAASADPHETSGVLRRAIAKAAGEDAVLVNLANVREIKIQAGRHGGIDLNGAITTIQRFVDTISAWNQLEYPILIED